MISLAKSGSTVTFTFDDNSTYLQNGTIEVPLNSLSLVIDESNMVTFKKSASNDIFVSANIAEFGMSKSDLESWYKNNMVGSTGGGTDTGTVQTMIDESISGKADSVSAVSSAEYVSSSTTINFKNIDGDIISSIDASDFVIDGMIDNVSIETISGESYLVIDFNTASGKEDIQIPISDIFDASNYYTKAEVDAITSGKVDTSAYSAYTAATETTIGNKLDISAITSSVTSASTDNEIPTAKAVFDAMPSATTYSAGRGIDITNDAISVSLPISAGTGSNSIAEGSGTTAGGDSSHAEGSGTTASGQSSHAEGTWTTANGDYSHAEGIYSTASGNASHAEGWGAIANGQSSHAEGSGNANGVCSHAEGSNTITNNDYEHASGRFNVSSSASTTFGDSGNTLFSVGNGGWGGRHNAFEIRQNGDMYLNNGTSDVKLQDYLQIKVVKLTQSAYDALSPNYDPNTLYIIKD